MNRMPLALLCALTWACALPASAQTAPTTPTTTPAKAQGPQSKAKADDNATGRERARVAKAENMRCKDIAKQKQDKQKKAAAT